MTIFDLVKAVEIAAYWDNMINERENFLGEELWPDAKKLGIDLSWFKGASGLPVVLKPSAFDVNAIPRPRIGFEKLSALASDQDVSTVGLCVSGRPKS